MSSTFESKVRKKAKRKKVVPQVVEFVDPAIASKKRRRENGKDNDIRGGRNRHRQEIREEKKNRRQLWKSIRALGSVGLKGKEKWQYKMDLVKKVPLDKYSGSPKSVSIPL